MIDTISGFARRIANIPRWHKLGFAQWIRAALVRRDRGGKTRAPLRKTTGSVPCGDTGHWRGLASVTGRKRTRSFMSKGEFIMFKITKLSAAVFALIPLIAGPAMAQDVDPMIDVNGDGFYSYPEIGSMYPEITDADFSAMDTTSDGLLDMAEVMAAQDAGLMPVAE
jgi:hypothetical protein